MANAIRRRMTINALSNVNPMLLSQINNNRVAGTDTANSAAVNDTSQVSPFAQLVSQLQQQLQPSNPAQFQQVTATLASDLQAAARTAQNSGRPGEADALNQLAAAFNQASQTGQLPSFAPHGAYPSGGFAPHGAYPADTSAHHHHHHHAGAQAAGQDLNSIAQSILTSLDPSSASPGASASTNTQE